MCPGCDIALTMQEATPQPDGQPSLVALAKEAEQTSLHSGPAHSEPPDDEPLYAARKKIYPQHVTGTFRTVKWTVLFITLGIYYLLPFVRWDRGPNAPHQAVLIDLPARRFYFFFIEIWPQEVYYLTGLLIIAAMTLFLMNAVAGRVWCGYLCPQTVWTDLFVTIERWIEGDRREHLLRDRQPWNFERAARAASKHFWWIMIAWWTGGAWVLYFADAPTLVKNLATFQAPFAAYAFIGILTFTTYALAGWMREQVCVYMCPWPRIQAALTDEYALNVTYRYDRGEPRASLKKSEAMHAQGQPAGDCIDCQQCVHVCPTGVDIRNGPDLGCIQCGLCIDACDAVMAKIGRPARLISYDTDINIKRRQEGLQARIPNCAHAHRAVRRPYRGDRRTHDVHTCDAPQRWRQRHSRPQSAICTAVGRRTAQCVCRSHPQQEPRDAKLHLESLRHRRRRCRGDRQRDALGRRPGD